MGGHGWASVALISIVFLMALDQVVSQQNLCSQTTPGGCPAGFFCSTNNVCKETGGNSESTYIIIGCVIAVIVIIIIVVLVLYCGRWGWVHRLKQRLAGDASPKKQPQFGMQPRPTLVYKAPKNTWQNIKLRLGGLRRNQYAEPSPFSQPSALGTSVMLQRPPSPSVLGINPNILPPDQMLGAQSTYVIGDQQQAGMDRFRSIDNQPFVATVSIDGKVPAIEYPPVQQVQRSPSPLPNQLQPMFQPPSPRPTHMINISAPQPTAPQFPQPQSQVYQPVMSAVHASQQIIQQPVHQTHEALPVQHSHQVYPQVYPSLDIGSTQGHTHSHGPPSYIDIPRKV